MSFWVCVGNEATGQPDARLGRENAKTQKCDITIPVMSMVGRPSVVRRQKYMTNICDITEPISLTRYRGPPSLFPPARATFCGEGAGASSSWRPSRPPVDFTTECRDYSAERCRGALERGGVPKRRRRPSSQNEPFVTLLTETSRHLELDHAPSRPRASVIPEAGDAGPQEKRPKSTTIVHSITQTACGRSATVAARRLSAHLNDVDRTMRSRLRNLRTRRHPLSARIT